MESIKEDKLRLLSSIPTLNKRNISKLQQRSSSVTLSKRRNKMLINNEERPKNLNLNISQININKNNNNYLIDLSERKINESNIRSDLLDKIDIFIEKDLMEEEQMEESNKIKSVLNDLILWDNEHLTDRKDKNSNSLMSSIQKEKSIFYSKNNIEKHFSKRLNNNKEKKQNIFLEKQSNSFRLKYKIINSSKISEEKINKYDIENNPKFKENSLLINLKKERKKLEVIQREELKKIYKKIIINKIKKMKYNQVMNNTYHLLDKARTEYNLSVDILRKRIEATQKYYEAIIKDFEIQYHFDKKLNKSINSNSNNNSLNSINYLINKKNRIKINNLELYEAKIKSYREYLSIVDDINKEIKQYENKFNNIQKELNDFLAQINKKISELNEENNKFKIIYKELSYKETQYYLSILKTGTDTRADGLSWIIKKLMELNIPINHSLFPKFLDKDEINYLIQISKLEFEKAQIIHILENLKQKKKGINKNKTIINESTNKNDLYQKFKFNINIYDDSYNNYYGSKLIDDLIKKYNSHYIMKNKLYSFRKQNNDDNLLLKKIKNNLNVFALNKDVNILKIKKDDEKLNLNKKEDYYSVLLLIEREKKLNVYIQKLRMKEYLKFKEKFRAIPIKELIYKKYYHQVFNALFGKNNFDISNSKK